MALAAGQTGHLADHQEGVYQVTHGATAGTARPTLGSASTAPNVVLWNGSVEPTNAVNGDLWWDSTNSLVKVKVSGSFVASGSGTHASADDPFGFGIPYTHHPLTAYEAGTVGANVAYYLRVIGGGTISKIGLDVGTSSGNICVAAYTNSGTGRSARPTGGLLASSGAVACPASGYQEVSLGSSVTINSGDWLALSCDNGTATFRCVKFGSVAGGGLVAGFQQQQSSAHPLPATPSSMSNSHARGFVLLGVA